MRRLLQINGDLEARVTALETQMVNTRREISKPVYKYSDYCSQTALQSMMTAQQTEVVAVQKEVAAVDTHLVQVCLSWLLHGEQGQFSTAGSTGRFKTEGSVIGYIWFESARFRL